MIPTIAFFNSQGGVGTTSLLYHLAWMYAELGHRVLAVDLDPQASLTAAMVDEERLEVLWSPGGSDTIYGAALPLIDGAGQSEPPHRESISANLELVVGDLSVSRLEDELAVQWADCLDGKGRAFRATAAFHTCIRSAAQASTADLVLVDLGPTLGAINRAALVACQHIVVPVAPDLFALQGLRVLGPVVRKWNDEWHERLARRPVSELVVPAHTTSLAGYVVMQSQVQLNRPAVSPNGWLQPPVVAPAARHPAGPATLRLRDWMSVIPDVYATAAQESNPAPHPTSDPRCLGMLKPHSSLLSLAREARKPVFRLRPADGALGAHAAAARQARKEFEDVADRVAAVTWRLDKQSRPGRPT